MQVDRALFSSIAIRTIINYMQEHNRTYYFRVLKYKLEEFEIKWQKEHDGYMEHIDLAGVVWDKLKAKYDSHVIDHEPTMTALFYDGKIPLSKNLVDRLMAQYNVAQEQDYENRSYNLADELWSLANEPV